MEQMAILQSTPTLCKLRKIIHYHKQHSHIQKMAYHLSRNHSIHTFIHYMLSNTQIGCVAANILWQLSNLPCHGGFSTMWVKDLSNAGLPWHKHSMLVIQSQHSFQPQTTWIRWKHHRAAWKPHRSVLQFIWPASSQLKREKIPDIVCLHHRCFCEPAPKGLVL